MATGRELSFIRVAQWCCCTHFRCWVYLSFILSSTVFFYYVFRGWDSKNGQHNPALSVVDRKRVKVTSKESVSLNDIPAKFRDYCHFDIKQDSEGSVEVDGYKLQGVVVVTRHGDRSPVVPVSQAVGSRPPPSCELHDIRQAEVFMQLRRFLTSSHFHRRFTFDRLFTKLAALPTDEACAAGQLTPSGAVQLVNVGKILRKRYSQSGLFVDKNLDVEIQSSMFNRTYQSALALCFGAFFAQDGDFPFNKLRFRASPNTHFCHSPWCSCNRLQELKMLLENEKSVEFRMEAPKRLKDAVSVISASILRMPFLSDPLALLDTLVGSYICRRAELPCVEGNCVRWKESLMVFDYVKERSNRLKEGMTMREMSVVEALPILSEVASAAERSTRRFFKLFSAHDVTLRPLLRALDVYDGHLPIYASRLVFEIHKSEAESSFYFRLLYNGLDLTRKLSFCSNVMSQISLCPISALKDFLVRDIFQVAKAKSLKDLC